MSKGKDMYARVRREGKKRDWRLWLAIGLVAVVLGGGVLGAVWSVRYQYDYKDFIDWLARDTIYARKFGTLTLETGGETYPLELNEGYEKFRVALAVDGGGRLGSPPDRDPDAVIDYGNGSRLELWDIPLTGYQNIPDGKMNGLFIQYHGRLGEQYAYDTKGLDLARCLNWLLPE